MMLEARLQKLRDFTQQRGFRRYRKSIEDSLVKYFRANKFSFEKRSAHLLKFMCEHEDPIVFPEEKITFTRTCINIPQWFKNSDLKKQLNKKKGDEFWSTGNVCPDYEILLSLGLGNIREKVCGLLQKNRDRKKKDFWEAVIISIDAVLDLARRYAICADAVGNKTIAAIMKNVPLKAPENFHEALQSLHFVHSIFYLSGMAHMGLGRLDQYLYPFYKNDIESGVLKKEQAFNLLAEFFIALNKDSDLYPGVQQGDNGQSLMLGGCKQDGSSAVNELTYLVMQVSKELKLIDPKINLRVDHSTPEDLLELGSELTKVGLGFPQYSNDEAVIPALVKKGYDIEDARNYTVAACWEFIIPGKGMEIVNQGALSFPYAVDAAFRKTMHFPYLFSMKRLKNNIRQNMKEQIVNILKNRNVRMLPAPFLSIFFDGAVDAGKDAVYSAKYRNVGIHGAGSANAADALAVIKTYAERKDIAGLKELLKAKKQNFEHQEELRRQLTDIMPKTGNDNDFVDSELKFLFDAYADCCDALSNKKRRIRPGSGTAMYYLWLTDTNNRFIIEPIVKATVDGRKKGDPLSTSLAPAHGVKVDGILSVLKSFSKIDYSRIMNGGPITVELTPSVFSSQDGIKKTAQLIRYFVMLGNQQLQLNVLDVAQLEDAVKHPERHRNLIVRVWGWSGYFCELAPEYQQHVINRHKYAI